MLLTATFVICLQTTHTTNWGDNIVNDKKIAMENNIKSSDLDLTDKVYTFLAPSDILTFKNYLEENYMYYLYIELVTPHNCSTMRITILDTNDKQFNVFESEMFYEPEFGRYFELPFGTVKSGLYNFTFYSESAQNFNMHILIEQGPKCLYDKMSQEDSENLIFYEVKRFDNAKHVEHDVSFETDEMYKFFICRVSAITIKENNEVRIDYKIEDPDGIEFEIYSNELLADIDGMNNFNFGTAVEGTYTIKMTIYCNVEYENVANAIVDDYKIVDADDENHTKSDLKKSKSDEHEVLEELSNSIFAQPVEWTIGTLIFVGGIAGTMVVVLIRHKKSNVVSLSYKKK